MTLIAAMLLAGAQPALAKAGDCGWVRGQYAISNGAGIHRIGMIGTKRILNLDVSDDELPPPIQKLYQAKRFKPGYSVIYADFYVCAVKPRIPGRMQYVHLNRIKNARIETYKSH